MTSTINPNNIDTTYPIAGQDNDSQGFRDNFTNTKTNFTYAASELTDLQAKAILKSQLSTGGSPALNNDMAGTLISNAKTSGFTEVSYSVTPGASISVDFSNGPYQTIVLGSSTAITSFLNFPGTAFGKLRLEVTVGNVAWTLTLPASVTVGAAYIVGYNTATQVITFPATGKIGRAHV